MNSAPRRVAVLPGDDAAPEAVQPTLPLLQTLELPIEWEILPDGEQMEREMSRKEASAFVRATVDRTDTVLFGATSGKTAGVGYLRWGKDTFANVRPIKWRPGYRSPLRAPAGIDYVIVRENIEDLYLGIEGDLAELTASSLELRPRVRLREPLQTRPGNIRSRSSPTPIPSGWCALPADWRGRGREPAARARSPARPNTTCCARRMNCSGASRAK